MHTYNVKIFTYSFLYTKAMLTVVNACGTDSRHQVVFFFAFFVSLLFWCWCCFCRCFVLLVHNYFYSIFAYLCMCMCLCVRASNMCAYRVSNSSSNKPQNVDVVGSVPLWQSNQTTTHPVNSYRFSLQPISLFSGSSRIVFILFFDSVKFYNSFI